MAEHIALITGASGGIGAAAARRFHRAGYRLGIHYNNSEAAARALCGELGEGALALGCDVSDPAQVDGMFAELERAFGAPDTLVCCHGVSQQKLLGDTSDADWRRVFAVNADGVFYCCRRAAAAMIREKRGCIVNVSSMWGICGASMEAAYSASKAAVQGFSKAIARELGPSGIRVNCIAPGVTDTAMNSAHTPETMAQLAEDTPLGRIGAPEEIAEAIFFLASDGASFITGQVLTADGGFLQI